MSKVFIIGAAGKVGRRLIRLTLGWSIIELTLGDTPVTEAVRRLGRERCSQ